MLGDVLLYLKTILVKIIISTPFFALKSSKILLHPYVQGSHRLEKYLNLEGFLEKSLKIKSVLKSTGKSLKNLEKTLNSTIFCRTLHC